MICIVEGQNGDSTDLDESDSDYGCGVASQSMLVPSVSLVEHDILLRVVRGIAKGPRGAKPCRGVFNS